MEKKTVLEETRDQIRVLYSPANDCIEKIQLNVVMAMINSMIVAQRASEKTCRAMRTHLQKHIKSKVR